MYAAGSGDQLGDEGQPPHVGDRAGAAGHLPLPRGAQHHPLQDRALRHSGGPRPVPRRLEGKWYRCQQNFWTFSKKNELVSNSPSREIFADKHHNFRGGI